MPAPSNNSRYERILTISFENENNPGRSVVVSIEKANGIQKLTIHGSCPVNDVRYNAENRSVRIPLHQLHMPQSTQVVESVAVIETQLPDEFDA